MEETETTETVETTDETPVEATETTEVSDDETVTYSRADLQKLRADAAKYRTRAKDAEAKVDELARALFAARVAATGKLANPAEVLFNADILDDADAINEAVDAAIAERPYIRARRIAGDVGQGPRGENTAPTDFSGLFR